MQIYIITYIQHDIRQLCAVIVSMKNHGVIAYSDIFFIKYLLR